ncbi:hypothetical protein ACFLYU_02570 [Candidatus Dependentiae bacterium]
MERKEHKKLQESINKILKIFLLGPFVNSGYKIKESNLDILKKRLEKLYKIAKANKKEPFEKPSSLLLRQDDRFFRRTGMINKTEETNLYIFERKLQELYNIVNANKKQPFVSSALLLSRVKKTKRTSLDIWDKKLRELYFMSYGKLYKDQEIDAHVRSEAKQLYDEFKAFGLVENPDSENMFLFKFSQNGNKLALISFVIKDVKEFISLAESEGWGLVFLLNSFYERILKNFINLINKDSSPQIFLLQTEEDDVEELYVLDKYFKVNFKLFDVKTGNLELYVKNCFNFIWSQNERYFAIKDTLYDLKTNKTLKIIEKFDDSGKLAARPLYFYYFNKSNKYLAVSSYNERELKLFDLKTFKPMLHIMKLIEDYNICEYTLSDDGNYLALGLDNGELHIIDIKAGKKLEFSLSNVNIPNYEFSRPDSTYLGVHFDNEGEFKVFEVKTGKELIKLDKCTGGFEFNNDNKHVWVEINKVACLYNINSNKKVFEGKDIYCNFSPDSKSLMVEDKDDRFLKLINLKSGTYKPKLEIFGKTGENECTPCGKFLFFYNSEGNEFYLRKLLDITTQKTSVLGFYAKHFELDSQKLNVIVQEEKTGKLLPKSYAFPIGYIKTYQDLIYKAQKKKKYCDIIIKHNN